MKKILIYVIVVCFLFTISGCGQNLHGPNGKVYKTYGLFNKKEVRQSEMEYDIIWGNVAWSIILSETIVAPIIFVGWSLYEPIGLKPVSLTKQTVTVTSPGVAATVEVVTPPVREDEGTDINYKGWD